MTRYAICAATLFFFALAATARAQVPNAGFEAWTGSEPDGWTTSNAAPTYTNVTQSPTAHTGSYAIRGDAVAFFTVVLGPVIQSGPGGHGFAYAQRPATVTGWYQFAPIGGDRFVINVELFTGGFGGTLIAIAAIADSTPHGAYTQFNVPFTYFSGDVPDLCIMQFSTTLPENGTTAHVGTYFLLDDLALEGTNDVSTQPVIPLNYTLGQNYPNPFNPSTTIRYGVPQRSFVTLAVYNALGQEVARLVNSTVDAGNHGVRFDGSGLPSGAYFYRLQAGNFVAIRQLVLLK